MDPLARRRKDQEEGPRGFDFPEFDEREFIRKETISFRSALTLLAWSIVAAVVSFVVWLLLANETMGWYVGLLIMAGMMYSLRWVLPILGVDTGHFGKKEWFGTGALFFFSWLAFFILIMNPPFFDGVEPELEIHVTPSAQEPGGVVDITLIATDNVAVDTNSIVFLVTAPDGSQRATEADLWAVVEDDTGVWAFNFTPEQEGTYRIQAEVSDATGGALVGAAHTAIVEVEFTVGPVVQLFMAGVDDEGVGRLTSPRDAVTVRLPPEMDVYRAWLENTHEDNTTARVYLEFDPDRSDEEYQEWFAQPAFNGFAEGRNTFRVHVEEHTTYFLGERFEQRGRIDAPLITEEAYSLVIPDPGLLGERVPDLPADRDPTIQPIPGPAGLLVVVASLIGVHWLHRRRTRDQSAPLSGV